MNRYRNDQHILAAGVAAPACVVLVKLLLGLLAIGLALAYLALCAARALQALTDEAAA